MIRTDWPSKNVFDGRQRNIPSAGFLTLKQKKALPQSPRIHARLLMDSSNQHRSRGLRQVDIEEFAGEATDGRASRRATWSDEGCQWMPRPSFRGLVSVIIPTYNRAALVQDSALSVVAQSYRPIELIIVDDGSTDSTPETIDAIRELVVDDSKFKIIYETQPNLGAQVARNRGLDSSQGEFVQFLDSDDLLHPLKIEKHVTFLEGNDSCDFVYSYANSEDLSDQSKGYSRYPTANWYVERFTTRNAFFCAPQIQAGLFRRSICKRIGPWDDRLEVNQDRDYFIRFAMANGSSDFIPEILSTVRIGAHARVSKGTTGSNRFERGLKAKMTIANRLFSDADNSPESACIVAEWLLQSFAFLTEPHGEEVTRVLSKHFQELQPCAFCKMRLNLMSKLISIVGKDRAGTLYLLQRKIRGKLFQWRVRVMWLTGMRKIKSAAKSIHFHVRSTRKRRCD